MTDRPGDAQRVGGRGKLLVALVVLAVVAAIVVWVLAGDDKRSTPLEDAAAGRDLSPAAADPTAPPQTARPQGRAAPDSSEGQAGAGGPTITGEAPPTADPGRNAPPPADAETAGRR